MGFWNFLKHNKDEENAIIPKLIGIDLGYGQIKVMTKDFNIRFLSAVGTPISDFSKTSAVSSEKELMDSLAITYQGQKYYVGHNALVNTRNGKMTLRQNKADVVDNKIKLLTALGLLIPEDENYGEFEIVTGLPVLEFKGQCDILTETIKNNGKPFECIMHYGNKEVKKIIKVNFVKVVSQGEGAFYDFVLNKKGEIVSGREDDVAGMVIVTDIGYRTTDIVAMENGRYIETISDQLNKGVNQMHQEILRLIMEHYNIKKELREMDSIVRSGELFHNMRTYKVHDIIAKAAKPFAEDIVENLHTITNDQLGGMQRIILTGGGAELVYPYIKKALSGVIEVSIMHDAEFCNASGYFKFGTLLKNTGNL
jgi:plasmid segregation protein ParM